MYGYSNMNPYPYYVHEQNYMPRDSQFVNQQVIAQIVAGLENEAQAVDLYGRLAEIAPNQKHKDTLMKALAVKNTNLQQLADLYFRVTGTQPVNYTNPVMFETYKDGLEIANQLEEQGSEAFEMYYRSSAHPLIREIFYRIWQGKKQLIPLSQLKSESIELKDYGANPFVINIETATKRNNNYRTALWTGEHLQVTLMSINVGDDIGLEIHPHLDQFIRIEQGQGLVQMGDSKDNLDFEARVYDDYAIMIPAGKWHNVTNTGKQPIKLYAIYAPPEHPFGTIHETKEEAMEAE